MGVAAKEFDRSNAEEEIRAAMTAASPEARELVKSVLSIERDKLHMKLPRHVIEEITEAVEDIVQ